MTKSEWENRVKIEFMRQQHNYYNQKSEKEDLNDVTLATLDNILNKAHNFMLNMQSLIADENLDKSVPLHIA